MQSEICCILNLAPIYNAPIYRLMDSELSCDFYIGDKIGLPIKLMDYNELKGFKKELKNLRLGGKFYWQKHSVPLVFKPYKKYIITGEPHCVSTWLILIIARILGRSTFLWTHGWYGRESLFIRIVKKIFFKLSFRIFLYGDYARKLMIREGFPADKLIPVYNSMDFDSQCKIRETLSYTDIYKKKFSNEFPVLIYIGRIQKNKKLDLLIESISLLLNRNVRCNLVIVGAEVEKTGIFELVENFNLSKYVWFYGASYNEQVLGELIYNANLCVVPGDIGLTVIHSFIFGTPVLTHNNFSQHGPEFEAITEGVTGDFFDNNSVADLSDKICDWINISSDKREYIRQECFKIVEERYNPYSQIAIIKNALNL
jgi:glycosyltransferase involved in cell wall biosynthesis